MSEPPWQKFRVGSPSKNPSWIEPDCQPLTSVAHVAHVPTALRIAEDGRLRADLVFDKSKLNTERIRVVWLSPNDWEGAGGFRYGNTRFWFDWAKLVRGKRSYWVESIAYGVEACRILLTKHDYSGTLEAYDPATRGGPWWKAPSGEHYWNGRYCLEIMVEGDLQLGSATMVDFVKHHSHRCNINPHGCEYRGKRSSIAGAEFIAAVVSRCRSVKLPGLLTCEGGPSSAVESAAGVLLRRVRNEWEEAGGSVRRSDPGAPALARAVLSAYASSGIRDDMRALIFHFVSVDDAEGSVADAIAEAIGLPDASNLLN